MTEQNQYEHPDFIDIEKHIKAIRKTFSRCGFAAFGLIAFTVIVSAVLTDYLDGANEEILSFYSKYLLIFNEIFIGAAVAVGALLLIGLPRSAPERQPVNTKLFFLLLCISVPVASVGNTAGSILTTTWNMLTGNEVTNKLTEILTETSPWQTALCAGILAPILEELFFRKLLIDRMRRHGELVAILTSALLFGLFHQNFSQFFYAFGLGLLLAYLYCRTGSYKTVTLFHMIFNFVMGVIPSLSLTKLLAMFNELSGLTEEEAIALLPSLLAEYAVPIIFYLLHITAIGALNIVGVILFILNVKKIKLEGDGIPISTGSRITAAIKNPGMIAAIILLAILMARSLFR